MSYRDSYRLSLFFAVLFGILSFVLALGWGVAMMRVAPAQAVMAAPLYGPPAPLDHPSTESLDASSARAPLTTSSIPGQSRTEVIPVALTPPNYPPRERPTGPMRIAVIIDDMGLMRHNSERVVALPPGLTLSYLPYAPDIQAQVNAARARGHEIMLHLPMESVHRDLHAGPGAIKVDQSSDERAARLTANLAAFDGYVGINNHMGSRVTSNADVMAQVMRAIDDRDVYFVDSWTSPRSVAYHKAAERNIPRARRDVFLDHDVGVAAVWQALRQAEAVARRTGSAVVIGHPKNDTIKVLSEWLATAPAQGIEIVPASRLTYHGTVANDPILTAGR